jgi:ABC-type Fe3+/spermidine/putrescine transport system ATPase subunit
VSLTASDRPTGLRANPSAPVEISGLTKRYAGFTALGGVDLKVGGGELLTLLGPSGCGKTTLLRAVAGFLAPDSGSIRIGGRTVDGVPAHKRNTGMVFQNYAIFPHMSVADNVAYGLKARGLPDSAIKARTAKALAQVRLSALAERFPDAMSGGQKQRVGLARAMAVEPDVLLMDEPLSNLDAKLRVEMREEIRRMQREIGITTIYVTHDQEEALAISDRVAVMERGEIRQIAPPREIYDQPQHAFVAEFIGGCNWFDATYAGDMLRFAAGPAIRPLPGAAGVRRQTGTVRVAVRGEDLRLATATDDPAACLVGRTTMLSFLGQRVRVQAHLDASDAVLHADLPADLDLPAEGSPIRLAFDASDLRIFDAADGRRIA